MITLTEIQATRLDYASRDDAAMASALSVGRTKLMSRMIGVGTVLDALGPSDGAAVLDNIQLVAATVPAVKYGYQLLERDKLDVALTSVRGQFDQLAQAGIITQAQADTLKALAEIPDPVSVNEVSDVLNAAGY